jgi:WD40 repeat protein
VPCFTTTVSVYNVESGNLIRGMHDEGAGWIFSIAVAGEGCEVHLEEEVGDVGLDKVVWLASGRNDGSVRIWDLKTGRCVTTLHPTDIPQDSHSNGVSMARDRRRVVHFTEPRSRSPDIGGLHVWDLSSDGTQERYEFVHGCERKLGFEFASAALLYQDKSKRSSVEQCSSRAVRFERSLHWEKQRKLSLSGRSFRAGRPSGGLVISEEVERLEVTDSMLLMRIEDNLVAELAESDRMICCRVANCEDRVLVAAVNRETGALTVLDALTSEIINELRTTGVNAIRSVVAFQREDGRVFVVTGDRRGMIRMRMGDSGKLIGQWQALRNPVFDVAIAVKAGKVMGAYGSGGLWIWSFEEEGPRVFQSSNSPAIADTLPPRRTDAVLNISSHLRSIKSIAFSGDGKVAASCAFWDKFVLVWDTAKGTVLRKPKFNKASRVRPGVVAVSSSGDWILCASFVEGDFENAYLNLWGPSNQEFSVRFRHGKMGVRCVTINTSSQDRPHGAIICEREKDGCEVCEWSLSGSSGPEIIITPTTASDDVVLELQQAPQGSRELLFQIIGKTKLHVRNAALDGAVRCTCKAAAVFDSMINCKYAWSEMTAQPDDRAGTSPKVAVGLWDGAVHFMQVRWNDG